MTRFKIGGAVVLVGLLLLSILWFSQATASTSPVKKEGSPHPPTSFNIQDSYRATGGTAIHPHLGASSTGPAFTQQDVMTFVRTYGFPSGPLVLGAHLQFLTIQFVPAREASKLMAGERIPRPDDYLVCYVRVKGPFLLTYVHGGPPLPGIKTPKSAETGDMVFDAHTGNMLGWGVY